MDYSDAEQVEPPAPPATPRSDAGLELVGPYTLIAQIAAGDFTTVHLAQKDGALGFNRLAAIKRLKPSFANQPEWTQLLLDEARLSAVVRHPNIVDILDVGTDAGVYIVLEYVEGADLDVLIGRAGKERHPRYLVPPIVDALMGLHAVHTAHDELGESLSMVHQAPRAQHILVGIDGVSRITDFSQVSARGLIPSTLRGKRLSIGYMAPEQVLVSEPVSPRTDVFIAGITLWETLTGSRLFHADTPALARRAITERHIPRPSEVGLKPPRAFDDVCMRALQRNPDQRYGSALEMAQELRDLALNEALYASASELGQWVRALASRALVERRRALGSDEPSQEIPLPANERAPSVQVAFTSSHSHSQPPPLPSSPSFFGSSTQAHSGSVGSWPSSGSAAVNHAPQSDGVIADDPSRVARSRTVPVAPALPKAPRVSRPPSSKSTLMGISPNQRSSTPPPLASTHGYESPSQEPPSYDAQGYDAPSYDAPSYDSKGYDTSPRSRESSAFLGMAIPPAGQPVARGRRRPSINSTLIGSKAPNVTLPEGALLKDMNVGSRAAPSYSQPPSIIDTGSHGRRDSRSIPPAQSYPPPAQSYAPPAQSYAPPAQSYAPPATHGFADAFESTEEQRPPLQPSSAAQRMIDEPEQGNPRSGAYRTRSRTPTAPPPRSLTPNPYGTADGVVPADIFARVQAARREAGDSLRPSGWDDGDSFDGAERSRGLGLGSLLLIGVIAVGFFGYRQWSEREPVVAPVEQPAAPSAAAPSVAEPEPVAPLAAPQQDKPAELAPPEPAAAEAAPAPTQMAPLEPAAPAAEPAVAPRRAEHSARTQARRQRPPAATREPSEEPAARPARTPRAPSGGNEALPDNPY